jgi:hypothetical protein
VNRQKLAEEEKKMNDKAAERSKFYSEVDKRSVQSNNKASPTHDNQSNLSSAKSENKSGMSSVSEKKETTFEMLRREREEKRKRDTQKGGLEGSDMEIISDSNSDDVSEMTDPTYATKDEKKRRSPKNTKRGLEDVIN